MNFILKIRIKIEKKNDLIPNSTNCKDNPEKVPKLVLINYRTIFMIKTQPKKNTTMTKCRLCRATIKPIN